MIQKHNRTKNRSQAGSGAAAFTVIYHPWQPRAPHNPVVLIVHLPISSYYMLVIRLVWCLIAPFMRFLCILMHANCSRSKEEMCVLAHQNLCLGTNLTAATNSLSPNCAIEVRRPGIGRQIQGSWLSVPLFPPDYFTPRSSRKPHPFGLKVPWTAQI